MLCTGFPIIHARQLKYTAVYGDNVNMICYLQENEELPIIETTWTRLPSNSTDGISFKDRKKTQVYSRSELLLTLKNVRKDDIGYYLCNARNANGIGNSKPIHLDVIGGKRLNYSFVFHKVEVHQYVVNLFSILNIIYNSMKFAEDR